MEKAVTTKKDWASKKSASAKTSNTWCQLSQKHISVIMNLLLMMLLFLQLLGHNPITSPSFIATFWDELMLSENAKTLLSAVFNFMTKKFLWTRWSWTPCWMSVWCTHNVLICWHKQTWVSVHRLVSSKFWMQQRPNSIADSCKRNWWAQKWKKLTNSLILCHWLSITFTASAGHFSFLFPAKNSWCVWVSGHLLSSNDSSAICQPHHKNSQESVSPEKQKLTDLPPVQRSLFFTFPLHLHPLFFMLCQQLPDGAVVEEPACGINMTRKSKFLKCWGRENIFECGNILICLNKLEAQPAAKSLWLFCCATKNTEEGHFWQLCSLERVLNCLVFHFVSRLKAKEVVHVKNCFWLNSGTFEELCTKFNFPKLESSSTSICSSTRGSVWAPETPCFLLQVSVLFVVCADEEWQHWPPSTSLSAWWCCATNNWHHCVFVLQNSSHCDRCNCWCNPHIILNDGPLISSNNLSLKWSYFPTTKCHMWLLKWLW